jgi:hypothetical protein
MNPRIKDVAGILRYIKAGKSFNYVIDKVNNLINTFIIKLHQFVYYLHLN